MAKLPGKSGISAVAEPCCPKGSRSTWLAGSPATMTDPELERLTLAVLLQASFTFRSGFAVRHGREWLCGGLFLVLGGSPAAAGSFLSGSLLVGVGATWRPYSSSLCPLPGDTTGLGCAASRYAASECRFRRHFPLRPPRSSCCRAR